MCISIICTSILHSSIYLAYKHATEYYVQRHKQRKKKKVFYMYISISVWPVIGSDEGMIFIWKNVSQNKTKR